MKVNNMFFKILAVVTLMAPMFANAEVTLNRLSCTPAGMNENLLFEFTSESDVVGSYSVIGSLRVNNAQGRTVEETTNVGIRYVLKAAANEVGSALTNLTGDLGRSGKIQIAMTSQGQAVIHSDLFSPTMNFPNGKTANCVFMSHIRPKPSLSGSN